MFGLGSTGVQYVGMTGTTASAVRSVTRLLCGGAVFEEARLLTCSDRHAFAFIDQYNEKIVTGQGFTSGYRGEGPGWLATVLQLLERHDVSVEEYEVSPELMQRLIKASLTQRDLNWLFEKASPIRPVRWHEYVYAMDSSGRTTPQNLSRRYPCAIPFGLIDVRILDLAVTFEADPDRSISLACRRLEDLVRARTTIEDHGARLFSRVFVNEGSPLTWQLPDPGEAKARGVMFATVFGAFRNARAHREKPYTEEAEALREFLLVNQLFVLEAQAVTRTSSP